MVWLFWLFFSFLKSTLSNIICTFIVLDVTSHYVLHVRGWCPVSHSSQHKLPQGDQDPITKCRGCPGIVFYFIFWWWFAGYTLTLLLYGCLTNKNINEWIWVEIILSSREISTLQSWSNISQSHVNADNNSSQFFWKVCCCLETGLWIFLAVLLCGRFKPAKGSSCDAHDCVIQSVPAGQNQVPPYCCFSHKKPFHLDTHLNKEENTCPLNTCEINSLTRTKIL